MNQARDCLSALSPSRSPYIKLKSGYENSRVQNARVRSEQHFLRDGVQSSVQYWRNWINHRARKFFGTSWKSWKPLIVGKLYSARDSAWEHNTWTKASSATVIRHDIFGWPFRIFFSCPKSKDWRAISSTGRHSSLDNFFHLLKSSSWVTDGVWPTNFNE